MFLQEAVKGLIGQVEDRRVCLRPRHLGGLWLWGLRAETERKDSKGNRGETSFLKNQETLQLACNLYGRRREKIKKSDPAVTPHST